MRLSPFCRGIIPCCACECWKYRLVGTWTRVQSSFSISHWFAEPADFVEHKCWWFCPWIITAFMQTVGKGGCTEMSFYFQPCKLVWEAKAHFAPTSIETQKKMALTRRVSAATGWIGTDGMAKEQIEDHCTSTLRIATEMGVSSTNDGEKVLNADTATATAHGRDAPSFGISGGSVGMGASHEAEIHRTDVSVYRADSVVGDVEPIAEVSENQGQTIRLNLLEVGDKDEIAGSNLLILYRLLCPNNFVGSVIGKVGMLLNSIKLETNARVKVGDLVVGSDDRVITIYCYVKTIEDLNIDNDFDYGKPPVCSAQDTLMGVHYIIAAACEEFFKQMSLLMKRRQEMAIRSRNSSSCGKPSWNSYASGKVDSFSTGNDLSAESCRHEIIVNVHQAGFSAPTPILAQSWLIALQDLDIVTVAKTGLGKPLGCLFPGFVHLNSWRNNTQMGPSVLVLSPTRELATQIQDEAVQFGKLSQISCTTAYRNRSWQSLLVFVANLSCTKNPYFNLHEEFSLFPKLGCSSEQGNENNGAGFAQISFKGEACIHCNVDQEGDKKSLILGGGVFGGIAITFDEHFNASLFLPYFFLSTFGHIHCKTSFHGPEMQSEQTLLRS
ncbi:hypothetical protein RHMOL_Rhmol04G0051100 [Rhododendron molle]|uniref:Uncharacterized protein n=1 Tax=Rhododendron molle TaxID=49168 RepID=A0ACC0NZJ8_RHOML|nr:hypothetical protein RHMOL_Rhmol04G0051100 [Rhododendron molle]